MSLKVTIYALWRFANMERPFQALTEGDFEPASLGLEAGQVRDGLEKAVQRGSLLRAERGKQVYFFLNSPTRPGLCQGLYSGARTGGGCLHRSPRKAGDLPAV